MKNFHQEEKFDKKKGSGGGRDFHGERRGGNRSFGERSGNRSFGERSGNRSFGDRGGNRSFGDRGGRRDFHGKHSERSSMYQAVCSECDKQCEVPFKPSGEKPVYCSDCFGMMKDYAPKQGGRENFRRSQFDDKQMFEAICDGCGNECEVPFRPSGSKPVYCSRCFEKENNFRDKNTDKYTDKNTDKYKEQFEILNIKLDRILKAFASFSVISKNSVQDTKIVKNEATPVFKKQEQTIDTQQKSAQNKKIIKKEETPKENAKKAIPKKPNNKKIAIKKKK